MPGRVVDTRAQQQTDPICALTGLSCERQRMARQEIDRDATVLKRMMGGVGWGASMASVIGFPEVMLRLSSTR